MLDLAPSSPSTLESDRAPGFDTLPDIARKFRRLTAEIGATGFHVFALGPNSEQKRLVPCMDGEYPGISDGTRVLAATLPGPLAELLTGSAGVAAWKTDGTGRVAAFATTGWPEAAEISSSATGIAFSVTTERGQKGIVAFTGPALSLDGEEVLETHWRCHTLFGVVAGLRLPEEGQRPAISRRELECLKLTANGLTSEEIARKLRLSVHTANQYLASTTQKLNAVNRVHAVAKALRAGLID